MTYPLNPSQAPYLTPGSLHDLSLESTLKELPLYHCVVSIHQTGAELATIFEQYPLLPGAILIDEQAEEDGMKGMISRKQLLEYLLLPQGLDLFLSHPLSVLQHYQRSETLILKGETPILEGNRRALRRPHALILEPIVVQISPQIYQLLDYAQLSLVSWQIRGIETQIRYERTQTQLIQSERMASLGRLVDGVAHEILDPVGFIWGNLTYITSYSQQLITLIYAYDQAFPDPPQAIQDLQIDFDFDYLQEDFPKILESIKTGAQRLKALASSLQNFCHVDDVYPKSADLHSCLDGICLLLKTRISREIKITKNYGHLPPVPCYIGKLSQVFINILSHAINALLEQTVTQEIAEEFNHPLENKKFPCITIETQVISRSSPKIPLDLRLVSIRIMDNGPGLSIEQQEKLKESFSLVNNADTETSLAVSYQIITAKHGGEFHLRSQLGEGTEFEILLPLL